MRNQREMRSSLGGESSPGSARLSKERLAPCKVAEAQETPQDIATQGVDGLVCTLQIISSTNCLLLRIR